jgi:hypothetical protein
MAQNLLKGECEMPVTKKASRARPSAPKAKTRVAGKVSRVRSSVASASAAPSSRAKAATRAQAGARAQGTSRAQPAAAATPARGKKWVSRVKRVVAHAVSGR